jgi:hypothetical protein
VSREWPGEVEPVKPSPRETALRVQLQALDERLERGSPLERGYERLLRERRITARLLAAQRIDELIPERVEPRSGTDPER